MASKVNRAGTTSSRGGMITTRQLSTPQAVPNGAPTQWASQPATQPSYVPYGATLAGGGYAPIYYDPVYRNYGYWDSLGHWMMWNAIFNGGGGRSYYYYDSNPGYNPGYYHASHGSSMLSIVFGIMVIGVLIALGMYFYYQHAAEVEEHYNLQPVYAQPATSQPAYTYAATASPPMSSQRVMTRRSPNLEPWLSFPTGSFITLSDNQSMEDSQKRGQGFTGIRYAVESSAIADDSEGFASWALITLNDQHQKLLLVVKSVDNEIDHRIYYASEEFRPARREDVVKRGDVWLFEAPEDENNFDAADLKYTAEITQKNDAGELAYVRKDQGERHADYTETPVRSGTNDLLATIVEYSTADKTDNPELLVLEIGAASRRTGEVSLYLGCPIQPSEIDVLKA